MKIAVVGGGSTYSPELVHGLAARAELLGLDEIALTDVDPARLEVVGGFASRMAHAIDPRLRIRHTEDLDAALEGARFVVVQIRVGGQAARLEDEQLGLHSGVIGQETTGVGGMAKALRTIGPLLEIADRVTARAPEATLVNFTNPVSIVTEALLRHRPELPVVGLCNIPLSQRMELAAHLGVSPEQVELDSVGLNHLSFVRGVLVDGQDVLPELVADVSKLLASGHRPKNIPDLDFPAELLTSLGMIPSDYLRYFFMEPETIEEQRNKDVLRAKEVMQIERELLALYADPAQHERPEALKKRGGAFYSHAAIEIIEAICKDTGDRLVLDVRNGETVAELPPEACVEVPCRVDARGAHPLPQRPLEPEIRGLLQAVKAYEELTVQAALHKRRRELYLATLAHPLTRGATRAAALTDAMMARLGWSEDR